MYLKGFNPMFLKSAIGFVLALASMGSWVVCLGIAKPVVDQFAQLPPTIGPALVTLPAVAVACLWWGANLVKPRTTALQQQRTDEKIQVANEQALLKIDALESKIHTLENALSKALQKG
jgi:hypothetical protein